MLKKLLVFDADGVLFNNTLGGFKEILALLGKKEEMKKIDEEYQRRKFAGPWGLKQLAKLYRGFSEEKLKNIAQEYCQFNLMRGTKELVREIKNRGYFAGALSSNPQFLMNTLKELLGLDFSQGTVLEFKDELATGRISRKVDRYEKAEILKKEMKNFALEKERVIVIGNSLTDIPMAQEAGKFIAFNVKEEARKEADVIIEEKDLRKIIRYL